jgi:SAM-dependent methyltransferase
MNGRVVRLVYEVVTRLGFNPALKAADVPDGWLVDLIEGEDRLPPGRALDLGCGAGRNSTYLSRHGWDVIGIDMIAQAVQAARSKAAGAGAKARFIQGDVTRLPELDLGDGYGLIVDSGCYYGLPENQRDAYAQGVTSVAAPAAVLLMAGFTKIPGLIPGISEDDLRRRFGGWEIRSSAIVPAEEIMRHTRIPPPLRIGMRSGRLKIRRFELSRTPT